MYMCLSLYDVAAGICLTCLLDMPIINLFCNMGLTSTICFIAQMDKVRLFTHVRCPMLMVDEQNG